MNRPAHALCFEIRKQDSIADAVQDDLIPVLVHLCDNANTAEVLHVKTF